MSHWMILRIHLAANQLAPKMSSTCSTLKNKNGRPKSMCQYLWAYPGMQFSHFKYCSHKIASVTGGRSSCEKPVSHLTWLEVCPTIVIDTNTAVLCGGRGSDDLPSGKCFEYSATNDKWTEWAEKLNVPRWGLGMSVYKGKCRLNGCS
jgi:hypothetical protein